MLKTIGSVKSRANTHVSEKVTIKTIARISIRMLNQQLTPVRVCTARILSLRNLLFPLRNYYYFPKARIVEAPEIVSDKYDNRGLLVVD